MSSQSVVWLPSLAHWKALQSAYTGIARDAILVTADLATAVDIEQSGRVPTEVWSFLKAGDIEKNKQVAWDLSRDWYKPFWGDLSFGGINLGEVARNQMYLPFVAALNAETVWSRVLDTLRPREVVGFKPLQSGIPIDWTEHTQTEVPAAILSWLASQQGLNKRQLPAPVGFSLEGSRERKQVAHEADLVFPNHGDSSYLGLMFLGGGRDFRDQKQLVEALVQTNGWRVNHIDVGELPRLNESDGGHIPWQSLLGLPPDGGRLREEIADGWRRFKQAIYSGLHPVLFANPNLDFQYRYYCDQLWSFAQAIAATDWVLDCRPANALVLSNDIGTLRGAVFAARRRGIPTIELVHGGIAYLEIYDFATDWMIVWGKAQRRELMRFGRAGDRILLGGNYNYAVPKVDHQLLEQKKQELCHQLGIAPTRQIVLLVTVQTNIEITVPRVDLIAHREAWRALAEYAWKHPEVALVVKPHPIYDYPQFYERLGLSFDKTIHVLKGDVDLFSLLPVCNVAVLVNGASTAALEAMLHNKPVIFIRNAVYEVDGYRSPLDEEGVIWVDDLASLESVLTDVLNDTPLRKRAIERAQRFKEDYLSAVDQESLAATMAHLEQKMTNQPCAVADPLITSRRRMAQAITAYLQTHNGPTFRSECESIISDTKMEKHQAAGSLLGWVLASLHRPKGEQLPKTVVNLWQWFPKCWQMNWVERFQLLSQVHSLLFFDNVVTGSRWRAGYHLWAGRFWRLTGRLLAIGS